MIHVIVDQSFWIGSRSMAVILPSSTQTFKLRLGELKWMLWPIDISQDLGLRWGMSSIANVHCVNNIGSTVVALPAHAHDDVIKWKHFPRNWPFVREIHRSPVNFPHKGQWRGALMVSLIYTWINDWINNREAGDLRRQHGHYDVIVMNCDLW